MLVKRTISDTVLSLARAFRVITITGPRQAGKTVLAKMCFPSHTVFDMDDPELQLRWKQDPNSLLSQVSGKYFIDEFQNMPDILSRIKIIVDETQMPGQFVLTGSNQFEFMPHLSQSLAGRTALLKLLPLSLQEMYEGSKVDVFSAIQRGFYPALLNSQVDTYAFYNSYIGTYLERDIRSLALVKDLSQFRIFLGLLAGRTGCELNKNKLAADTGVDVKTITQWLSLLETSSMIYYLRPWYKNWKKRIVKSPKIYFIDTGLICHLLGIRDAGTLANHPLRGEIFEAFVVSEVIKHYQNKGMNPGLYFLKERTGLELDLIIDHGVNQTVMEIKSGTTLHQSWLSGLSSAQRTNADFSKTMLVYNGEETYTVKGIDVTSVAEINRMLES